MLEFIDQIASSPAVQHIAPVILAAVNSVTAPRIAAQNEQKTQNAIEAVLPGGGQEVKEFTDDMPGSTRRS